MKNLSKFLITVILLVAALGFVSAGYEDVEYKEKISVTHYYPEYYRSVTKEVEAYYDNDDRYSTYKYRHGYSYRTEKDYWEKYHDKDFDYDYSRKDYRRDLSSKRSWKYYDSDYRGDFHGSHHNEYYGHYDYGKDYYWKHNYYKGSYEKKVCYNSPPRGKLFYVSCP
jgi:hypothetical protein